MEIGIDYTAAALQGAGIGRYTRGLVDAVVRLLPPGDRVTLLCPRDAPPSAIPQEQARVRIKHLPFADRYQTIIWHRLRLPFPVESITGPLDIFHATNFLLPPVRKAARIVTIHDLAFLVKPQYAYPDLQRFLARAVPRSVAAADHILADSEASRQDALRLFHLKPERVTVVGAGVEPRFRPQPAEDLEPVRQRYGLPWPFVFTISTLEPRKNFDGLIRAFAKARRQAGFPHHLVIAGGKGWLYDDIFAEVERSQASGFVHFLGFVLDDDLPSLYSMADLFAFPSHYEGFGLPVLEAMACGVPVLCSDTSSLPELAGDAARLVPTGNEPALVAALADLLTDDTARAALAATGPVRAAAFTWDTAARRLYDVYRSLV